MERLPLIRAFILSFAFLAAAAGCAGVPKNPEQISTLSEEALYKEYYWAQSVASFYVGWKGTSQQEYIDRISTRILNLPNPKWSGQMREAMLQNRLMIGMDERQVLLMRGKPQTVNRSVYASGVNDQWVYAADTQRQASYIYFENGIVSSLQESFP